MSMNKDNPSDADISDLYRTTQSDGPDAALDAAILAQAEAATKPKRKHPAWIAPVGLAATMLLGVNLAMNLKDFSSEPNIYSESSVASTKRSAPAVDSNDIEALTDAPSSPAPDLSSASEYDPESKNGFYRDRIQHVPSNLGRDTSTHENTSLTDQAPVPHATVPDQLAETEESSGSGARQRVARKLEDQITAEHDIPEALRAKERLASQPGLVADSALPATINTPTRAPGIPMVAAAPEMEPEVAVATAVSPIMANAKQTPAPVEPPVSVAVASDVSPQQAASTVSEPAPPNEAVNDDRELDQLVVAESTLSKRQARARILLKAPNSAMRNAGQMINSFNAVAPPQTDSSERYVCDLEILKIDENDIEAAKYSALSFDPPLNALSWLGYILELTQNQDYTMACAHLAAYYQLFPEVALVATLPIVLPPEK